MSVLIQTVSSPKVAPRRAIVEVATKHGLTTDTLTLRPLGYADESAFCGAVERSREELRRWIPIERKEEPTSEFFNRLVHLAIQGDKNTSAFRRGVFLSDNTFIGMVNIIKIERGMEWTAEINWWIDSAQTGHGYGSKALEALMDHGLAEIPIGLGLHKVRAMICLDNLASVHLAKKLGFKQSGVTDLLEINNALIMHHEFVRWA